MFRELVTAKERNREEINRDITNAWYVAKLSRVKHIPKLDTLLTRVEQPKAQTPKQMKGVLAMLGYKTKPMSEEAKRATKLPMFKANG